MTESKPPRGRPFAPGSSGNPRGRPAGSRNTASLALEKIMQDDGEAVARAVVDAAKGGDMTAARLVLERLCPPSKSRAISVELPPVRTAEDVLSALTTVVDAVAAGTITPDEGQAVAALLETKRKAIETTEIERRLTALEQKEG